MSDLVKAEQVIKLKARIVKLEVQNQRMFDDARYAEMLRRFSKEHQWGGVFLVMRNYFGLDHVGIPPGMEEVVALNAKLQDEVSKLRFEKIHDINAAGGQCEENAALKAEVERLRKAGDAMAKCIQPPAHGPGEYESEYDAWFAAKEGRDAK